MEKEAIGQELVCNDNLVVALESFGSGEQLNKGNPYGEVGAKQ